MTLLQHKKTVLACGAGCILAYGAYLENYAITLTKMNIHHKNLPASFQGYRILQVSDLHNTLFGKHQKNLIKKIKEANPDCIVITGDLFDKKRTHRHNVSPLQAAIAFMVTYCPVYYVPGNHEATSTLYPYVRRFLYAKGVHMLENQCVYLQRNEDRLCICGIVDPKFYSEKKRGFKHQLLTMAEIAKDEFSILLSHHPEYFNQYAGKFSIVYSGHAHGGQFRIPYFGGLYSPDQGLFPKYCEGIFQKNGTTMVVSRGLGNSRMPQRIYNRPQLILTTLFL